MKSGFVAVVGRPNVGKSTLVNGLVGHKVSIISSRPQTTRNTIRGVLTIGTPEPETQIVFVDTPGLGKPKNVLGERLNSVVHRTLAEVDAVLFVLDATQKIGPGDRRIAERLLGLSQVTVIAVINKVDIASKARVAEQLREASLWGFGAYVPVSSLKRDGLDRILGELVPLMPQGPLYFPLRRDVRSARRIADLGNRAREVPGPTTRGASAFGGGEDRGHRARGWLDADLGVGLCRA